MARILCELQAASSSYFAMASTESFAGDFDFTFKFWSRDAATGILLGYSANTQNFIAVISGGTLRVRIANVNFNSSAGVVEPSKLYTCRVTRVGTALTAYLDGVSVLTGTTSGTLPLDRIGVYGAVALPFNGYIYDVDLGTRLWALDQATGTTEASDPAGNTLTYTNIPEAQRYTFTEAGGGTYWWGTNGDNLELDVQQGAADAYIIAGQSNGIGRATLVGGTDDVYSTLNGRVMEFGFDRQYRLGAQNTLDHADESAGDMGFWREMCLGLPNGNILLLPCADGGTSFVFNHWNQGNPVNTAAVNSVNAGMLSNSNNTLKAMIWVHGETDAENNRTQAQYLADLQAMRTGMITDITDMTADTPWIVCQIKYSGGTATQINAALQEFVDGIPNGALVTTTDLTLFDTYHYDAASTRTIGTRVATAMQQFLVTLAASDAKLFKLETALSKSGHISDLEIEWLQGLHVSVTSNCSMDAWHQYWDSQAVAAGGFNDRAYAWLGSLGHTGSISDRWLSYWNS